VLPMLKGSPRVDELNHHPRLFFSQWTGTLGKLAIQIDPSLRNFQAPIARLLL